MEIPDNLFLMESSNRAYIMGDSSHISPERSITGSLVYFMVLNIFVGLPIAIVLSAIEAILVSESFLAVFSFFAVVMLFITALIAYLSYLKAKKLEEQGQIILGKIVGYEESSMFSLMGVSSETILLYKFNTPEGDEITGDRAMSRLENQETERDLPDPDTPIAILYLKKKWHTPL
jgi:hypothetical protein